MDDEDVQRLRGAGGDSREAEKVIARALMDAGFKAYAGPRQAIDRVAAAAIREDVDIKGISRHEGSHFHIARELPQKLQESGSGDIPLPIGGSIPLVDVEPSRAIGVKEVFLPGTPLAEIVKRLEEIVSERGRG